MPLCKCCFAAGVTKSEKTDVSVLSAVECLCVHRMGVAFWLSLVKIPLVKHTPLITGADWTGQRSGYGLHFWAEENL